MYFLIVGVCLASLPLKAENFSDLLKKIDRHPIIGATQSSFAHKAFSIRTQSSLKNPSLKFSALNATLPDLSFAKTPMSSKQITITQSFPLTSRLIHLQDQSDLVNEAGRSQSLFQANSIRAKLWATSATIESLSEQTKIVRESLIWIEQVDKSTQKLYSTGKISQINLLEIKIRRKELESKLQELHYQTKQSEYLAGYLVGTDQPTKIENTPWDTLNTRSVKPSNAELDSLSKQSKAANAKLEAARLSYIPDLTIGAAYSLRENIDGHGDFVSGFVQFSLPLWGETSNRVEAAKAEFLGKRERLRNFELQQSRLISTFREEIKTLQKELQLTSEVIEIAETERRLATKKYSFGKLSIFQLLEVELKLRNKKLKKEILEKKIRDSKLELLLLKGDDLRV